MKNTSPQAGALLQATDLKNQPAAAKIQYDSATAIADAYAQELLPILEQLRQLHRQKSARQTPGGNQ